MGSGDSNSVDPVHVYVDYMPLPSEGARKFSNDASDGALGPWHSRHVKIAHVALLATSAYQFLIGAYICLGIGSSFPAVSSALSGTLGLVQAVRYLVVDSSNPANELKLVRLQHHVLLYRRFYGCTCLIQLVGCGMLEG